MPFVYILQNNLGRFYVGSTDNLERRLKHHDGGHTPSTKRLGLMRLVLFQEYQTLSEARLVESKLKKLKRKDYIAKMVQDGFIRIKPR